MIAIWCDTINERIRYTFQLIFESILKEKIILCDQLKDFENYNHAKLSYSIQPVDNSIWIQPSGLLHEESLENKTIKVDQWKEMPIFFRTSEDSSIPFDLFSASFYLASRYEEYVQNTHDVHHRYTGVNSLAVENSFLTKPIIDIWAHELKSVITKKFPNHIFPKKQFILQPTIDIDHPFAYWHKSLLRTTGGLIKAFLKFNFKKFNDRFITLLHLKNDPYNTYDYLQTEFSKYKLHPYYFVLLNKGGKFDSSVSSNNKHYRLLISNLKGEVGIHPSYQSNYDENLISKEIDRLKRIIKTNIRYSRQHFLKVSLPNTYRNLINHGIENDFSMGYAAKTGFRAGTCTPFYFFDLEKNRTTNLKVHPFAIMDGTLNYYQKLTVDEAKTQIDQLLMEVKKVEGTFNYIWHNETLSNQDHWAGWREVFEYLNEKGSELANE